MRRALAVTLAALRLAAYLAGELIVANLRLAKDMLMPLRRLRPGVVAVPLRVRSDRQISMLANLITLTPGTLSLDVSSDGATLYVHCMDASDPERVRAGIRDGFERYVMELRI